MSTLGEFPGALESTHLAPQVWESRMHEVVVGVALTAVLGGLLVPAVNAHIGRRRERFNVSNELLETLADCLWMYWKLAMRVAYYGSKGPDFRDDHAAALEAWDSEEAWDNGCQIQIQISRSKRVLPKETHEDLDEAQRVVVEELDKEVEKLRDRKDTAAWKDFYNCLYGPTRGEIHELLFQLTEHVALAQEAWLVRRWREFRGKAPDPIARPVGVVPPPIPPGRSEADGGPASDHVEPSDFGEPS